MPQQSKLITLDDPGDYLEWRRADNNTVEIVDIAVHSERRKGRGRELLRRLFREVRNAETVWAITRATNLIGGQWYEACGFHVDRVLRNFYDPDAGCVDAILYARSPKGDV